MSSEEQAQTRAIAFYLPQFHRIPENDQWWGEGFTEWTNVQKARPLFAGHQQPVRPGSLGYYDLTNPDARAEQARLASAHGIAGFCYWHYWFGDGRRLLERPFAEVLESGKPNFPFCLCWANQTWTGVWHGAPNRVLIEQRYPGEKDLAEHVELLARAFADPRYIKVGGKPLFLIYAPAAIPDCSAYIRRFRALLEQRGFPGVHLIGMSNKLSPDRPRGFDQWMQYGPGDFLDARPLRPATRVLRRFAAAPAGALLGDRMRVRLRAPITYNYSDVVSAAFRSVPCTKEYVPCVLTGWDNTPRSGRRGVVFTGFTPELLRRYVEKAVDFAVESGAPDRFVFLKAWNEWAEGNVLEPTEHGGLSALESVKSGLLQHDAPRRQEYGGESDRTPRVARG